MAAKTRPRRIKKLIGSVLASLTVGGVMAIAAALGVNITTELAGLIVGIAAATGTYLAPRNEESQ